MKFLKFLPFIVLLACKKEVKTPSTNNEEELITTLVIKTERQSDNQINYYSFADPDGIGGNSPTIDTIKLSNSSNYTISLYVLNESITPTDTINDEIEMEKDEHLFCFTTPSTDFDVQITDKDNNDLPLGLISNWTTTSTDTSTITIQLKHQPEIKTGDCNLGETDIEATFPIVIN